MWRSRCWQKGGDVQRYDYHHVVTLEDTNFVGNVYFARYLSWQGKCRELFLQEHAPAVIQDLYTGLALVTVHCSCDFFDELRLSDHVVISMVLRGTDQNRVAMGFDYERVSPGPRTSVARGVQEVACMRRTNGRLQVTPVPEALRAALAGYTSAPTEVGGPAS